MSKLMSDERLKELEKFVEHFSNIIEAHELKEACDEIRRLRAQLETIQQNARELVTVKKRLREDNERLAKENDLLNSNAAAGLYNIFKNLWKHAEDENAKLRKVVEAVKKEKARREDYEHESQDKTEEFQRLCAAEEKTDNALRELDEEEK